MATVINNPGENTTDSGTGFLVGVVVLVLAVFLFLVYGVPALQNSTAKQGIGGSAPQIQVPDKIDVNLNQSGDQK